MVIEYEGICECKRHLNHYKITRLYLNRVFSFDLIEYFSNLHTLSFNTRGEILDSENSYFLFNSFPLLTSLTTLSINLLRYNNKRQNWIYIPKI